MRFSQVLTLVVTMGAVAGCGSMSADRVPPQTSPAGLRVQVPVPHDVIMLTLDAKKGRVMRSTVLSLPDPEQHFELNFKGGAFKSRELNVSVHPNGALKSYSFDVKQQVSEAAGALAAAAGAIHATAEHIEKAKAPAAPSPPYSEENALLQLQLLNMMLQANLEAISNGEPLPYPEIFGSTEGDGQMP